jgi:hypothetical protein
MPEIPARAKLAASLKSRGTCTDGTGIDGQGFRRFGENPSHAGYPYRREKDRRKDKTPIGKLI